MAHVVHPDVLVERRRYEDCPDVYVLPASFALPWIREVETSLAFPGGGPDRMTASCVSLGESGWKGSG